MDKTACLRGPQKYLIYVVRTERRGRPEGVYANSPFPTGSLSQIYGPRSAPKSTTFPHPPALKSTTKAMDFQTKFDNIINLKATSLQRNFGNKFNHKVRDLQRIIDDKYNRKERYLQRLFK